MRELMIVRHAKSDWSEGSLSDFDRPLNNRGSNDAARMAQWIKNHSIHPETIISSPALRAKQTALAIADQLKLSESAIQFDPQLYLANTKTLLGKIKKVDNKYQSAMLIGHNPGLESLVETLAIDPPPLTSSGKLLTTANFVLLQLRGDWHNVAPRQAKLVHFIRPKEIP